MTVRVLSDWSQFYDWVGTVASFNDEFAMVGFRLGWEPIRFDWVNLEVVDG